MYKCHKELLKQINDSIIFPKQILEYYTYSIQKDKYEPWCSTYLKKIAKELMSNEYICKEKRGYMREIKIGGKKQNYKCYHKSKTSKKQSDSFVITRKGIEYLKKELDYNTEEAQKKKRNISGKKKAQNEERIKRENLTNAFFNKIEEFESERMKYKYTSALEIKQKNENKTIKGSKFFGVLECMTKNEKTKIPIYNTGNYITRVIPKVETYLRQWLGIIEKEKEKIILAENARVIMASINEAKKKKKGKSSKLLVDSTEEKNYYFNLDIGGKKQLEIFKIENRKEYWKYAFEQDERTKKMVTKKNIENAESFNFLAQSETKVIYVGFEQELNEIMQMISYIKYTGKTIIVICLKEQMANYKIFFSEAKAEKRLEFITTKSVYG